MAKIQASMKDVSTDFSPVEPGVYEFEIKEVKEEKLQNGRLRYDVKSEVVGVVEPGSDEDIGRSITDRIHIHKKDGDLNEFGLAQIKRYFEVTLGDERANADDADTDELINQRFRGQVVIRSYKVEDNLTGKEEERKTNEISRFAPLG